MFFRKRGKKWYYMFTITDENGKKKQIERVGGLTKAEAKQAAMRALGKNLDFTGTWNEPERMPFKSYWEIFMEEYVEKKLKPATIRSYASIARNHLLPALGGMELCKITPRILQNLLNQKTQLSRGTINTIVFVLKKSFAYCSDMCQFLPSNPARGISAPAPSKSALRQEAHVFDAGQMERIFEQFPPGHKFHMPVMLGYHAGMRLGECLALQWEDINWKDAEIHIHRTRLEDGTLQDSTKSFSSTRTIPIGSKLLHELKQMRKSMLEQQVAYGKYWHGENFVCCLENGKHMKANDMRWFGQWCKKTFGYGSFHSLRHTHATMLLEAGEDLELVSKRLGHSTISLTAKTYSHVLDGRKEKVRKLLDQIL